MTHAFRAALLIGCCALFALHDRCVMAAPPEGYALAWSDEFNGNALDGSKWWIKTGANRDATNALETVAVNGGDLVITTYTANVGGVPFHRTGMVTGYGLFQQQYGYMEARIKFSDSPGMWSAFWVQSPTYGNPEDNAAVAGAELDVVEHRAVDKNNVSVANKAQIAVHWNGYGSAHQTTNTLTPNLGLADGYHLYGVEWDAAGYKFYIDNHLQWSENRADSISQRPEYMILSSEVENNSWAGKIPTGGYGNLAGSTTKMSVDYVRVYAVPEPTSYVMLGAAAIVAFLHFCQRLR
jgi:beta-glucanase (GH16 family)